jgi:hypothetical protein
MRNKSRAGKKSALRLFCNCEQKKNEPIVEDAELSFGLQFTIEFLYKLRYTQSMEMLESFPKIN